MADPGALPRPLEEAPRRPVRQVQPPREGTKGTVLVAEDAADQREIICEMLELDGFDVVLAHDGEEALDLVNKVRPSAIILDVILPLADGWEVLHVLKKDPRTSDIPVLVISVVDQPGFGRRLGADEYLLKPLEPSSLRRTVHRLVGVPGAGGENESVENGSYTKLN
jgi:CheY-like chemotaxis protein